MALPRKQDSVTGDLVALAGYAAVRKTFDRAVEACVERLTKADWVMAFGLLSIEDGLGDERGRGETVNFITDTALYSRPGDPIVRVARKRPIDRIAQRLGVRNDRLLGLVANRLPSAFFSIFKVEECDETGHVVVRDLVDGGRRLEVMDNGLAQTAPGTIFAARLVDLGPWHIGFGIVVVLRKSEAVAVLIALSHPGELAEKRDSLHELIYGSRIHATNLILEALEPLFLAMSMVIDMGDVEVEDTVAQLSSLFADPEDDPTPAAGEAN